jgi:undecaprenyl-diphosphatase
MNRFDESIIEFLNQFAGRSHRVDELIVTLDTPILKGGVLIALVWWVWFIDETEDVARRRRVLLGTLGACIVAVFVARGLAHILPFRTRPLYSPGLDFTPPFGAGEIDLSNWSSFPSDHAVLFFALSTGLWSARRRFGVFAYAYTTLMICLPRIYLGIHWPTDILAGALLGTAIGWTATRDRVSGVLGDHPLDWLARFPGPFYAGMFLVTFEIAQLGADARDIASRLGHIL